MTWGYEFKTPHVKNCAQRISWYQQSKRCSQLTGHRADVAFQPSKSPPASTTWTLLSCQNLEKAATQQLLRLYMQDVKACTATAKHAVHWLMPSKQLQLVSRRAAASSRLMQAAPIRWPNLGWP